MRSKVTLACVVSVFLASLAMAQTPNGAIRGRVVDPNDAVVPGATVTVSSEALQGTRLAVTNGEGDFVIPSLPSGSYSVKVTLSGFQTVERTVVVAATQTVSLDISLATARLAESVDVVGTATPLAATSQSATRFGQDLMNVLPTTRSLDATVLMAPAVHPTGPAGAYSIGGAVSFESLFTLNGVVITENLRGQPYTLYVEDAIQETTVATSGISAEFGRFTGGVVTAVTKSGGNTFSGSYRESFVNDNWRTVTPIKESRLDKLVPTHEYTFGGPVVRNRLWFFTAGRLQNQQASRTLATTNIPYVRTSNENRYEGKVTFSPGTGQSLQVSYIHISQLVKNNVFQNAMDTLSFYDQGQPQDLVAVNYNRNFGSNFFVEAQVTNRVFTFTGAGARSTDLIDGTLLIDRSQGGTSFRYHAATFCGVCDDEQRNNGDVLVKATYLKSTKAFGSHTVVFGYDRFNDHRFSNNHQSGSDYRILGTGTIIRGTDIYPVFLGSGSTIIQWNPIDLSSQGTDLATNSLFINDQWRVNSKVSATLGLRYDKNAGEDAAGNKVSDSSRFSPRVGVVFDPKADGRWNFSANVGTYTAGLNSGVADVSAGGNPATYQFVYRGPSINANPNVANPVSQSDAIRQVFDWYNANGASNLPKILIDVPGISSKIGGSLKSPNVREFSAGVSRQLTNRGSVRADFVYRDYNDFYASVTNASTGKVSNPFGEQFDLTLLENSNIVDRRYKGLTLQGAYRVGTAHVGANYTLSRTWGTFDGEDSASGPLTTGLLSFPEYVQASWNSPEGDLSVDQRHRVRLWGTYPVPVPERIGRLNVGVVHQYGSGVPYGAVGPVDTTPYVTGTNYIAPSGDRADGLWNYYFTARDAFRTDGSNRTDLSLDYEYRIKATARPVSVFLHFDTLNLFNQFDLCGCGGTVFTNGGSTNLSRINTGVLTAGNSATLQPFNPFTTTPVEGVNWAKRTGTAAFGTANSQFAYTSPRMWRFSTGVRF